MSHRLIFGWLGVAAAAWALAHPVTGRAAQVLVLEPHGHAAARDDPSLVSASAEPPARQWRAAPRARAASAATVLRQLGLLHRRGTISTPAYRQYVGSFNTAQRALKQLSGTRAAELAAVIANIEEIAAQGMLAPSRLPALFLTLDENHKWWTTGPLLSPGQRVQFPGSQLVWEYYPGQGIELQELASWGQVDWMYHAGPRYFPRMRRLEEELIPLATHRGGGLTWEYFFHFGGGNPPWTSAISQGTAIQALAEAARAFHDGSFLTLAQRALTIFREAPPTGVAVTTSRGSRYLLYSFDAARGDEVINGFLQSLIGLYDYAKISGDPEGWRLFRAGDAEARAELPSYDTGAWSLYQPGQESSLSYHQLVTSFLQQLCSRTHAAIYCTAAQHFRSYLKTPPALKLLTSSLRARVAGVIRFRLSKVSRAGITLLRMGHPVFSTSAQFPYGTHAFSIPALSHSGNYVVRLDATDLAGNYNQISGRVRVSR